MIVADFRISKKNGSKVQPLQPKYNLKVGETGKIAVEPETRVSQTKVKYVKIAPIFAHSKAINPLFYRLTYK